MIIFAGAMERIYDSLRIDFCVYVVLLQSYRVYSVYKSDVI